MAITLIVTLIIWYSQYELNTISICKFPASLLQSSVSHDPSENTLMWWFDISDYYQCFHNSWISKVRFKGDLFLF